MSDRATAWARSVKCGSSARKLVLSTIASHVAPHEGEADGFHCGYPGQELLAEECEMGERSLRDHLNELVAMGLIQRRKRYRRDGKRTSDWFRVPVHNHGDIGSFPEPETLKTPAEWPETALPADSAGSAVSGATTGRFEGHYRQTAAGKRKDLRSKERSSSSSIRSNSSVEEPKGTEEEENENQQHPPPRQFFPVDDLTVIAATPIFDDIPSPNTYQEPAERVTEAINWGKWPVPNTEKKKALHEALRVALEQGWSEKDLHIYCQRAVDKAQQTPLKYLLNALGPQWLDEPPAKPKPVERKPLLPEDSNHKVVSRSQVALASAESLARAVDANRSKYSCAAASYVEWVPV
jgi:hypothetical protein